MRYEAVLWDVETYARLLCITGARARIERYAKERREKLDIEHIARIHVAKNKVYSRLILNGGIGFRHNVLDWIENLKCNKVTQGIVTTTSAENLSALMRVNLGVNWRDLFLCVFVVRMCRKNSYAQRHILWC